MRQHAVSLPETHVNRNSLSAAANDSTNQAHVVQAGAKALDVLDAFDHDRPQLTLAEITQRVGLPKSSVLRLLRTLASRGYVERTADGTRYELGLKLFVLGSRVAARFDVREVALPVLTQLRDECGDTVNLAVLSGPDVLYIAVLESLHPLRMTAFVGSREPAYATSLGKAMLAHRPSTELQTLLRPEQWVALTPRTIVNWKRFNRELENIRRQGFALDDEETLSGVRCVGAPIFNHMGEVCAALSVSGPLSRASDERLPELTKFVQSAAAEISRKLGSAGQSTTRFEVPSLTDRSGPKTASSRRSAGKRSFR